MALKIALYIGPYRFPMTPSDIGIELLEAMRGARHEIAAVLVSRDDVIHELALSYGLPVLVLPEELELPVGRMRKIFQMPRLKPELEAWLARLRDLAPDVGVVYCGGWVPPQLAKLPKRGFINMHPGPLPEFTGYDPEKFLILNHHTKGWGTIHHVAERFDTGNILCASAPVRLTPGMTTPELAKLISRQCFKALPGVLDRFEEGVPEGEPQEESRRGYVTRHRGYRESVVDWASDTEMKLDARLRAFNSLDDGMCLKGRRKESLCVIYDLESWRGDYPGQAGDEIGVYVGAGKFAGMPVIRTREGVAVVCFGEGATDVDTEVQLTPEQLIRPGARPRQTTPQHISLFPK